MALLNPGSLTHTLYNALQEVIELSTERVCKGHLFVCMAHLPPILLDTPEDSTSHQTHEWTLPHKELAAFDC